MASDAGAPRSADDAWQVMAATATGAHHTAHGAGSQDAVLHRRVRGGVVVAVSDGHGHSRHFRSGRGSALAVQVAVDTLASWWEAQDGRRPPSEEDLQRDVLPLMIHRWQEAVAADVAAFPFQAADEAYRRPGDEAVTAYGATLLVAVIGSRWVALAQIGDGDVVLVPVSGTAGRPLPDDPELDGLRTTSLCQVDALDAFRVAVLDMASTPVRLLLLATDGYGNAQRDDDWPPAVGSDIAAALQVQGAEWVGQQLPAWVARCASGEGSGDDTTLALAVAPPTASGPPSPGSPLGRRRTGTGAAAALLVVAAVSGGLWLHDAHRSRAPDHAAPTKLTSQPFRSSPAHLSRHPMRGRSHG